MNDITINASVDLNPVITTVVKETLKPINEWALELIRNERLTPEDVEALHQKLIDAAGVIGGAVHEKIVEMEWITATASHPVRINWIKPRQDGS